MLLLSAAQSRMFIEGLNQDEPKRICFDAEGMPVYCSVTNSDTDVVVVHCSGSQADGEQRGRSMSSWRTYPSSAT